MRETDLAAAVRAGKLLAAAVLATGGLAACGEAGGGSEPVATGDPARTFAPLVRLAEKERAYPVGALFILRHAGLEWAGGPCGFERDITPSAELAPGEPSPLPPLVPRRLGRESDAYRVRPLHEGCDRRRPRVFTTAQRTRPYDTEDRPAGLHVDEGFNLDLELDPGRGRRRLGADGTLAGVPAYYAIERAPIGGRPGLRVSYWVFFGVEARIDAYGETLREGDWERVDVLAERGPGRGRYTPRAVEYRIGDRVERVAWQDVELAHGTHPVAYLDRGRHTPRPAGECARCTDWRTWRTLRDVRAEPWWGYGGGWGEIGPSSEDSGPSGPSPFEIGGASPRRLSR